MRSIGLLQEIGVFQARCGLEWTRVEWALLYDQGRAGYSPHPC